MKKRSKRNQPKQLIQPDPVVVPTIEDLAVLRQNRQRLQQECQAASVHFDALLDTLYEDFQLGVRPAAPTGPLPEAA